MSFVAAALPRWVFHECWKGEKVEDCIQKTIKLLSKRCFMKDLWDSCLRISS